MSDKILSKSIPVNRTEVAIFDDSFSFMLDKFTSEMKKMDEEMNKFSTNLTNLYGQDPLMVTTSSHPLTWDSVTDSPLVEGDGDEKTLKLQFDVSMFLPNEVKVAIVNDVLTVSATHKEKTDNSSVFRQFKRDFILPKGTIPEEVGSSISKDGVLLVQAPLHKPALVEVKGPNDASRSSQESPSKVTSKASEK